MRVPRLHGGALVRRGERSQEDVARVDIRQVSLDDLPLVPLRASAEVTPHRVDRLPARGETVRLAPLPFVHPNATLDAFGVEPGKWARTYADQVRVIQDALGAGLLKGYDGARDVLLFSAHLHVGGATFSKSERPLHVSDAFATHVESLPPVAYAAFGHIHKPQALPGGKMASAGADWQTNPATQIRWGLGYIKSVYGTPCAAWAHSQATNWY